MTRSCPTFLRTDVDILKTQSSSLSYAVCSLPLLRNRYAETVQTILKDRSEISNDRKWCIDRLFSETCHALKIVKAVKSSQHSIRSKEFFYIVIQKLSVQNLLLTIRFSIAPMGRIDRIDTTRPKLIFKFQSIFFCRNNTRVIPWYDS